MIPTRRPLMIFLDNASFEKETRDCGRAADGSWLVCFPPAARRTVCLPCPAWSRAELTSPPPRPFCCSWCETPNTPTSRRCFAATACPLFMRRPSLPVYPVTNLAVPPQVLFKSGGGEWFDPIWRSCVIYGSTRSIGAMNQLRCRLGEVNTSNNLCFSSADPEAHAPPVSRHWPSCLLQRPLGASSAFTLFCHDVQHFQHPDRNLE